MSNVDFDFILEQEGYKLKGYVPDAKKSNSGVTIASGFDLGARNLSDLSGLPQTIIDKLTPFLGIKGAKADEVASNLVVTDPEAKIINEFAKSSELSKLKSRWQETTGSSFDDLPKHKATAIASVAFQYGNLATETPNFWRQVTNDDWDAAEANLRKFGDNYDSRRNREADYYVSGLSQSEKDSKKKFRTELDTAKQYGIQEAQIFEGRDRGDFEDLGTAPTATTPEPLVDTSPFDTPAMTSIDQAPVSDEVIVEDVDLPNEELGTIDLPTIEDVLADPEPVLDEIPTLPESKANSLMPSNSEFYGGYTTLYGEPNKQYGNKIPSQIQDQDAYDYSIFDESFDNVWSAAFRQNNFLPSLIRYMELGDEKYKPQEGYSVFQDEQFKKRVGGTAGLWRFKNIGSNAEANLIYDRMQADAEDAALLSSTRSGVANVAASLATPTIVAPLAPMKVLQAANRTRRFVGGSAFTYALMAPEQMLIDSQSTQRDASHGALALTAASLLGGTLSVAFGRPLRAGFTQPQRLLTGPAEEGVEEGDGVFRSAGASVSPDRARQTAYADMEDEALEATGIGAEKLPWNPVIRMMKSNNPIVRGLAVGMVDVGGMMQKKVRSKEAEMEQSVETTFRTKYLSQLRDSVRISDEAYLSYRGITPSSSDSVRAFQMIKEYGKTKFSSVDHLTETEFRIRVSKAMRRGDVDRTGDEVSEFVTEAVTGYRRLFNFIKDEATKARLFEKELQESLEAAKRAGNKAAVIRIQKNIDRVKEQGVTPNTAPSYLPRIYRIDKIMANPAKFMSVLETHARNTLGMTPTQAKVYAREGMDTVTRSRPYLDLNNPTDELDWVSRASGAKARVLDIPDELIEEFLENDIEVLIRHHVKTMGMDIELALKYGDVNMQSVIDDVTAEYKRLIDETTDADKRLKLAKELENDLRDIRGLRDRLRGTYGASKDPHAMSSRFVRTMKSINVLIGMGGAMVSSVPDVARTVMVEGLTNTYQKGFRAMFSDQGRILRSMSRDELNKAAVGVDAVLGLRAHAFSDVGDLFGSRFGVERRLNQATGMFFLFNGLNLWNQALKEFAGNVTMLRMTESIMKPWGKLTASEKEKLLKNGIGQQDHMRMQALIKENGEQVNGEWMPNTDAWDAPMRLKFRNALNQNVERIIITPGAGDRALWTSTEYGSLLTQFKSYGQGATIRMMTAGLQEKDGAFWQGAFLLVGLAAMVNEIKRIQYGKTDEETFNEKMMNAIDRSGVLGWFMDVNNAVEKISDYKLGMRPFMSDQPQYRLPDSAKAGEVFGPTASNLMTFGSVMGDVVTFNANEQTLRDSRFIMPGTTLPYLDPVYDGIFGQ